MHFTKIAIWTNYKSVKYLLHYLTPKSFDEFRINLTCEIFTETKLWMWSIPATHNFSEIQMNW
jgi:hypothetical protein